MSIFMYNVQCTVTQWQLKAKGPPPTGSRSTFEFPSRVNLYGPSFTLSFTVSPGHWVNKAECRPSIGLAGAKRLTRSDFMLNLLYFTKSSYPPPTPF